MDGVLIIDKPTGPTSHDIVARTRRVLGITRIGHLGTLDPLATGVLPLVVGRATRLAQFFRNRDKVYEGRMRLGFATDSYDRSGTVVGEVSDSLPDHAELDLIFREFTGNIQQVPPPVSAKKIGGVKAYKLARKNIEVDLPASNIQVMEFALLDYQPPYARFRVHCSGGTYVRSLVHDAGRRAGCGAHVDELRRTASGEFLEEQAVTLERLAEMQAEDRLAEALVPAEKMLPEIPCYKVPPMIVPAVLTGRDFRTVPPMNAPRIKVLSHEGKLIAIADRADMGFFHPSIVL
jgi:tRNA pseudouridine55 synthase